MDLTLWLLIDAVLLAYWLAVVVFIVSEDRNPTAALAWLLVLIALPVLGLVLYFFFGRNWPEITQRSPATRRVREIRQAGLWVGVDVQPSLGTAKEICYRLMERAVLAKDTHGHTIRFAPPLVITEDDLDQVIAHTITAFEEAAAHVGDVRSDVETQIDA